MSKRWPNYECNERTADIYLDSGRQIRVWLNARHEVWQSSEAVAQFIKGIKAEPQWKGRTPEQTIDWIATMEGVNACQVIDGAYDPRVPGSMDPEPIGKVGVMAYFVPFDEHEPVDRRDRL